MTVLNLQSVPDGTGDPGPTPQSVIPSVQGPLIILWGLQDPFTPIDGPVARYFIDLATTRPHTVFEELEGAKHFLHDFTTN